MTPAASSQTSGHASRTKPVNCAYLHNAFGPGCPYCRKTPKSAAGASQRAPAQPGGRMLASRSALAPAG
jgi:hypothetical protein